MQREWRLTKGETPEAPTKKLVRSLRDAPDIGAQLGRMEVTLDHVSLSLEDRQAAIAVSFEAGMHYQAGRDIEDRARALLIEWSRESRDMAAKYAAVKGPAWASLIEWAGSTDD